VDAQRPPSSSDGAGQAAGGLSSPDSGQDVRGCVVAIASQATVSEDQWF